MKRTLSTIARSTAPATNGLPVHDYTYRGRGAGPWRPGERPCGVCGALPGSPCTGVRGALRDVVLDRYHAGRGSHG